MNKKVLFVCNDPSKKTNIVQSKMVLDELVKYQSHSGVKLFKSNPKFSHYILNSNADLYDVDIIKRDYEELVSIIKGNICEINVSYTESPYDAVVYQNCKKYGDEYIKLFDPDCVNIIKSILKPEGIFVINDSNSTEYNMAIAISPNGQEIDTLVSDSFAGPLDITYSTKNTMAVWIKK